MSLSFSFHGIDRGIQSLVAPRKKCDRHVFSVWRPDGMGKLVWIEMPRGVAPRLPVTADLAANAEEWIERIKQANPERIKR